MSRKGRKPLAVGHVERVSGSELAKLRLSMILKTMTAVFLDLGDARRRTTSPEATIAAQ